MPRIIVTSRYLKSGSSNNLSNYVKYIATRPGAVMNETERKNLSVTDSQTQLINDLLKDFPEGKDMFEYEDYIHSLNQATASKLIREITERNADRIANRENYVGYLGKRPGVVKIRTHGLFSQEDKPIDLNVAAKEISHHKGNVWTHVVSLRRDDAELTGYTDLKSWIELVKRNIPKIAEASKIDINNLKWYAAFHDKETNPHVHIIVYSTDTKEGFLTNKGIEIIRSAFANDIYHDELYNLYGRQTALRDDLKNKSSEIMNKLKQELLQGGIISEELKKDVIRLSGQLGNYKGRRYYKFLPPEAKKTVDDIFIKLSENKIISKMYDLWCEMEQQKHDIYSSAKVKFPPIYQNKAFHSVKNMIINTISEMGNLDDIVMDKIVSEPIDYDHSFEIEIEPVTEDNDMPIVAENDFDSKYTLEWNDKYKQACGLLYSKGSGREEYMKAEKLLINDAENGNVLAIHDLGKFYSTEKFGAKNQEKSHQYYCQSLKGFMHLQSALPHKSEQNIHKSNNLFTDKRAGKTEKLQSYIYYRIGKMHCYGLGTEQDFAEAFKWFEEAAESGNKYAQYSLGNLYYYGKGVKQSYDKAFEWYMRSSNMGQPYAAYAVAQMYANGETVEKDEVQAQNYYKQALAGFQKLEADEQADDNLFYKVGRMHMYGLGTEKETTKAIDYYLRAAELGNTNAKRSMAWEYILGKNIEQDIDKGIKLLAELAEGGDEYAKSTLQHIHDYKQTALANSILSLFAALSKLIEDDYIRNQRTLHSKADKKLRRMIEQKKEHLGIKSDSTLCYEQ